MDDGLMADERRFESSKGNDVRKVPQMKGYEKEKKRKEEEAKQENESNQTPSLFEHLVFLCQSNYVYTQNTP